METLKRKFSQKENLGGKKKIAKKQIKNNLNYFNNKNGDILKIIFLKTNYCIYSKLRLVNKFFREIISYFWIQKIHISKLSSHKFSNDIKGLKIQTGFDNEKYLNNEYLYEINNIPSSIKYLEFDEYTKEEYLMNIPKSIEFLNISYNNNIIGKIFFLKLLKNLKTLNIYGCKNIDLRILEYLDYETNICFKQKNSYLKVIFHAIIFSKINFIQKILEKKKNDNTLIKLLNIKENEVSLFLATCFSGRMDVLKLLLDYGFSVNINNLTKKENITLCSVFINKNYEMMKFLLNNKTNLFLKLDFENEEDYYENNFFQYKTKNNNKNNNNINEKLLNTYSNSFIEYYKNRIIKPKSFCIFLIGCKDIKYFDIFKFLMIYFKENYFNLSIKILDSNDKEIENINYEMKVIFYNQFIFQLLFKSCHYFNNEVFFFLLSLINLKEYINEFILGEYNLFLKSIECKNNEIFEFLLSNGANINIIRKKDGYNSLMIAYENNNLDIVFLLLINGININYKNKNNEDILSVYCNNKTSNIYNIKLFFEYGFKVTDNYCKIFHPLINCLKNNEFNNFQFLLEFFDFNKIIDNNRTIMFWVIKYCYKTIFQTIIILKNPKLNFLYNKLPLLYYIIKYDKFSMLYSNNDIENLEFNNQIFFLHIENIWIRNYIISKFFIIKNFILDWDFLLYNLNNSNLILKNIILSLINLLINNLISKIEIEILENIIINIKIIVNNIQKEKKNLSKYNKELFEALKINIIDFGEFLIKKLKNKTLKKEMKENINKILNNNFLFQFLEKIKI